MRYVISKISWCCFVFVLTFSLSSSQLFAQVEPKFSAQVEAGLQSSSQQYLNEIEKTSESGDTAKLIQFKLKGGLEPIDKLSFKGFYSKKLINYNRNDEFDQATQIFYVDGAYKFDWVKLGLDQSMANVKLDQQGFMSLNQRSIYLSKLFSNQWFFRVNKSQQEKKFKNLTERDSENHSLAINTYRFFDLGQSFIAFGIEDQTEESVTPEFDFAAKSYWVKYSKSFNAWQLDNNIQLSWRKLNKSFTQASQNLLEAANENPREDSSSFMSLRWELGLTSNFFLITQFELASNDSNLEDAEFDTNKMGISVKAKF
ncbi:hypothetical protein ACUR5C_11690 [Aliikangiella sp. IMCC44653]